MGIGDFFLERAASLYGLDEALKRIRASFNLGESSKIPIPKEIAKGSIDFVSRGLLNMFAIQCNLDWVLPYWVLMQYDAHSTSYVPGTVLSTNLTHRNWTSIGALDSEREPIVDPTGLLTPWFDGWSTDFWIGKSDYLIVPSKNTEVYQYLVKQLPLVVSQFIKKDVRIMMTAFVYLCEGEEIISHTLSVENLESTDVALSVFVNVRPYNPEGISIVSNIKYDAELRCLLVNDCPGIYLDVHPDRVFCSTQAEGDSSVEAFSGKSKTESFCKHGLATGFAEYRLHLKSGEVKDIAIRALTRAKKPEAIRRESVTKCTHQEMKRECITEWEKRLASSLKIRIPYQKMMNAFNGNKAHLYLFVDGDTITPGPYFYHHSWFRDQAYMVSALDKMGFHAEAERILLHYPRRQNDDGYFHSQEGEWDSNGEALWTYWQHYLYSRNKEFLREIFDSAHKGFLWIKKNREKRTGLLPAGYSAEHFGPNDTFYWDNFWSLAGVDAFTLMARELNEEKAAAEAATMLEEYNETVFQSIDRTRAKFDFPIIPSSPNRGIDSSIIGAICALYPLRLIQPRDVRITGTLQVIRRKYQRNNAFFHRVVHSGYNVYLTAQLAECYLFRRSSRVLPITQWIMDNISYTGCFPEAIHPITHGGCMGDGHHGWATADFLHLVRNLLFFEEDGGIVITPVIYHRWMEAGEIIEVKDAPSHFGPINFTIESKSDRIVLSFAPVYSVKPAFLEFSVPFSIQKVLVDGIETKFETSGIVRFSPNAHEVVVFR